MGDNNLYADASWEFDRTQRNAKEEKQEPLVACTECEDKYWPDELREGVCVCCITDKLAELADD